MSDWRASRTAGGECCVRLANGTFSADALHEQLVEGVNDLDIRAKTRRVLLEKGLTRQQLDGLFPDLPPSPDDTESPEGG